MNKIIYCSDLHGNKKLYDKLVSYANSHRSIEAVVIGGDLCPHGRSVNFEENIKSQKEFIESFLIPKIKEIKKDVFLMMGNDDFKVNLKILEKEEKKGSFKLLNDKAKKIGSKKIIGYSFVNETPFLLKDWEKLDTKESKQITDPKHDIISAPKTKGTIEQDMKKMAKADIYVFHCPPFETNLDVLPDKKYVGSKAIRSFIEHRQPLMTFHGHIHETVISSGEYTDKIGGTICLSAGSDYLEGILDAIIIDLDNPENNELEMV
mgnify:CR=1 FL=1